MEIISEKAIRRRRYWVDEIRNMSGNFADNSERLETLLSEEIQRDGPGSLVDHLRRIGDIPESYGSPTKAAAESQSTSPL